MALILPTLSSGEEQEIVAAIIAANAHGFTLTVVSTQTTCPICAGEDPFCPTCNGNPTIRTYDYVSMSGLSRAKGGEDKIYMPNGQYVDGDLLAVFPLTVLPGGYTSFDALLARTESVAAHDRTWVIDKWWLKGAPHNRVYVVLKEDESNYGARV